MSAGVEVAAGLLVLPAEAAAHPDIGPAVAAAGLAGAALEAVVVGVARLGDAEQFAEVVEPGCCAPARSVSGLFFQRAMNSSGVMPAV
ncbi:MAG: hypothetical protein V9E87_02200 [Gemmatimonadales bacterium]